MLMVYVLKFRTLFSFCSHKNVGYQDWKEKCLQEKQTGKTLIRLLPQKNYDLGLPRLSRLI